MTRNNDALIFLGILGILIILALFVGLIIGDYIGHARGIREAKAAIVESEGYPVSEWEVKE